MVDLTTQSLAETNGRGLDVHALPGRPRRLVVLPRSRTQNNVDVWIHQAEQKRGPTTTTPDWFNTAERTRFDHYIHDADRARFVARRGFLRDILSLYTGIEACSIRIGTRRGGKPWSIDDPLLEFNVTSASGTCIVAVGTTPLGVDAESRETFAEPDVVARRWLTPGERSRIRQIEPQRRAGAITLALVQKEAALKAAGVGFAISPGDVDTCANAGAGPITVATQPVTAWWITSIDLPGPLIGAVATTSPTPTISVNRWMPLR